MCKEASPTCPSTYQGFWDTSGAMVVSPEAMACGLPRQDAPILRAEAKHRAYIMWLFLP